jgi:hypothetical protein
MSALEEIILLCRSEAGGNKIISDLIKLAIGYRQRLLFLAENSVGVSSEALTKNRKKSIALLFQYERERDEILAQINEKALILGRRTLIDDICRLT